jgi:hypothetical protein
MKKELAEGKDRKETIQLYTTSTTVTRGEFRKLNKDSRTI